MTGGDGSKQDSWHQRDGIAPELARFLLAGAINTAIGYGVYLLATPAMGMHPAYALAYAVGIVSAYLLNSRFVFRRPLSKVTAARYPLVYLAQYLAGAVVLQILTQRVSMDSRWAGLLAIAASVPVSFFANRMVLASRRNAHD